MDTDTSKIFTIQGQQFVVKKLKVKQFKQAVKLLKGGGFDSNTSIIDTASYLLDEKLDELLNIAFPENAPKVDWDEVDFDQLLELVNSFLSVNAAVKNMLNG